MVLPLQRATSQSFAWELMILFSQLRLPKDLLTEQGMLFLSKLMVDLCRLLQLQQIKTSVYHLQRNGLVVHFNQTLKRMLH